MIAFVALAAPVSCTQDSPTEPEDRPADQQRHGAAGNNVPVSHQATPAEVAVDPPSSITIDAPAEEGAVGRQFTVSGSSATFQGVVNWELRFAGHPIDSGTAHGGEYGPGYFQFGVNAPAAGSYEIAVFEERGAQGGYTQLTLRRVTIA